MRKATEFRPTYNHIPDGSACRVYGSLDVKKVTGELTMLERRFCSAMAHHVVSKSAHNDSRPWLRQLRACRP